MVGIRNKCKSWPWYPSSLRVGLWKELTWSLTEVVDLSEYSSFHSWVMDSVDVDCSIICEVIKHVCGLNCSLLTTVPIIRRYFLGF